MTFRPSALPALAACAKYESDPVSGSGALRGTALDVAFRRVIALEKGMGDCMLTADDREAVTWAVDTARLLAGDHDLETSEKELKIEAENMTGTADMLCEGGNWSADLKTGQMRNYREQQAAYALGFMDRYFTDEWTTYLLFCDERCIIKEAFTRDEALEIIRKVKARALDPQAVATPCDYCGWCARRWKCPERLETVAWFLRLDPAAVDLEAAAGDPARCAALLDLTYTVAKDDGLHDKLKETATRHIAGGAAIPGWQMQKGRETRTVPALQIQANHGGRILLKDAGWQAVCEVLPTLSEAKFLALWQKAYGPDATVPDGVVNTNHGAAFLAKSRSKKK